MKITVAFFTYTPSPDHPRAAYANATLPALLDNLTYAKGELAYLIADDGSPPEHVEHLRAHLDRRNLPVTITHTDHRGYGGNYNAATQVTHSDGTDLVLAVEDDWLLTRNFDLSDLADALAENWHGLELSCVRLGYLGWTNPLRGDLIQRARQTFLLFDPECSEVHVFAGHPRLETVAFERRVGPWPEMMKAGYTEMEVCNRPESRAGVAWPLDAGVNASQDFASLFSHIGSEQA